MAQADLMDADIALETAVLPSTPPTAPSKAFKWHCL